MRNGYKIFSMQTLAKHSYLIIFLVFFLVVNFINEQQTRPPINVSMQNKAININQNILSIFHLGEKRFISSLLWIKTLLDSDEEHYKKKDKNSWMFLRFNSIIDLEPKFYFAYFFGGRYLSIVKDDPAGAEVIQAKGLNLFPNDFWLNYDAGYNYYFELGEAEKAIKLYETIVLYPEVKKYTPYLPSVLGRLKASEGDLTSAYELLLKMYQSESNEKETALKRKLRDSLYNIKAEIDLKCLNSTNDDQCNKKDFDGFPYIFKNGIFTTAKPFKKFRIFSKNKY